VDLFFCLSSFLITTLLLREHDLRGSIDVRAFWMRRILRIWPLYYLFLLLAATIIPYWRPDEQLCGLHLLNYWFFLGNWDAVFNGFLISGAGPLWSVSIEEQFYLFWPLVLRAVKPKRIIPLAVIALAGSNIFRLLYHPPEFNQQWCNTIYHVDPIALGVIGAALVQANRLKISTPLRIIILLAGLMATPMYFFWHGYQPFFHGEDLAVYPISSLSCLLIIMSVHDLKALPWDGQFMKGWAYLGRISYGLYVFHMLAIAWVVRQLYDGNPAGVLSGIKLGLFGFALALTIILAWASYAFWESPFLKLKKRFTYIASSPEQDASGTTLEKAI
jgi:peptidoglycan/LPS O-acetylase OafA/YrhL